MFALEKRGFAFKKQGVFALEMEGLALDKEWLAWVREARACVGAGGRVRGARAPGWPRARRPRAPRMPRQPGRSGLRGARRRVRRGRGCVREGRLACLRWAAGCRTSPPQGGGNPAREVSYTQRGVLYCSGVGYNYSGTCSTAGCAILQWGRGSPLRQWGVLSHRAGGGRFWPIRRAARAAAPSARPRAAWVRVRVRVRLGLP